jgi:ankyrin repeat protein
MMKKMDGPLIELYFVLFQCLLDNKAQKGLKNEDEQTPIHLAGKCGRTKYANQILHLQ